MFRSTLAKLADKLVKLLFVETVLVTDGVSRDGEVNYIEPYWWVILLRHAEEEGNINAFQLLWIFIKIGKEFLLEKKKEITSSKFVALKRQNKSKDNLVHFSGSFITNLALGLY